MGVYYFYFIPIKDRDVEIISDPSLNGIRMNLQLFRSVTRCIAEEVQYILLKSIDDLSMTFDKSKFDSNLENLTNNSQENVLSTLLNCFDVCGFSYERYLGISQYPLMVVKPRKSKAVLHTPKTTLDILNHCFLHMYQFLHVKQSSEECKQLNAVLQVGNARYKPAIHSAAKFVTCCVHNIVVEISTRRFYILKHECFKSKCIQGKFDHNIYEVIRQMLT
jgi:hypothetical protein